MCVVFSTGIPLLLVVALASFVLGYWVDKLLFVHFYRRPPAFNTQLSRTMSTLIPVLVVCKLAVGTWAISNVSLFRSVLDPLNVRLYIGMADRLFATWVPDTYASSAQRVTQLQAVSAAMRARHRLERCRAARRWAEGRPQVRTLPHTISPPTPSPPGR